jgi:cell division protein ZapA
MASEDKYNKKKFSIKVLGEKLVVTGNKTKEYITKLAKHINEIGDEITRAYPHLPRRRVIGLTTINMADEFFKLKEKYLQKIKENRELEEENEQLREKINSLQEEYEELSLLLEEVDD